MRYLRCKGSFCLILQVGLRNFDQDNPNKLQQKISNGYGLISYRILISKTIFSLNGTVLYKRRLEQPFKTQW